MATSKRGQAAYGIEEIFKLIKSKVIKASVLQSFEQYLNRYQKLKELDDEQLSKNARLFRIEKNLIDLSPETFEIVYRWIKDFRETFNILRKDLRAIDNTILEFALTKVFQHQRYPPLCDKNKFDQLLAARFLRIANKKRTGVYASLEVLLEESVEEIETKCIEYLKRRKFPLDKIQVKSILRQDKTIHSHISDLESRDEGDPFIFYAASIVYKHHIHLLCATEEGLEEYLFYPSELPSERESCDHKFIGHLSENNYFSLETTEQKFQKRDESEKLVREYQAKIEKLEKVIKDNKKKYLILSQEMEKSNEENLKLSIEMEKSKKENLRLSQEMEKIKKENLRLSQEMDKSKKENLRLSREMEKSKKENLRLSQEMEKSKKENLRLSQEMEKIKEENLKLSEEKKRYKQHVEVLEAKFKEVDSNFQLVNDKLDKLLSVQCEKCSLSNMSDSTNVKKAIDEDEKGKEHKQTNKNKSAQVANSAQNNNVRDEHNNVTNEHESAAKPKLSQNNEHDSARKPIPTQNNEHESAANPKLSQNNEHRDGPNNATTGKGNVASLFARQAKHSGIGEQRDKTLPPVNTIDRDPWKHHSKTVPN